MPEMTNEGRYGNRDPDPVRSNAEYDTRHVDWDDTGEPVYADSICATCGVVWIQHNGLSCYDRQHLGSRFFVRYEDKHPRQRTPSRFHVFESAVQRITNPQGETA